MTDFIQKCGVYHIDDIIQILPYQNHKTWYMVILLKF